MGRGAQNNLLYGSPIIVSGADEAKDAIDYKINDYKIFKNELWTYDLPTFTSAKQFEYNFPEMRNAYDFYNHVSSEDSNYHQLAKQEINSFFLSKLTSQGKGERWWLGTSNWQIRMPESNKTKALKAPIYRAFKKQSLKPNPLHPPGFGLIFPAKERSSAITKQIITYPSFVEQHNLTPVNFNTNNIREPLSAVANHKGVNYQLAKVDPRHLIAAEEAAQAPSNARWYFALGSSLLLYYSKSNKTAYAIVKVNPTLKEDHQ
jgi:hypothetical protein